MIRVHQGRPCPGSVWEIARSTPLRQLPNASGYDLRHLFIGSEGTLGLIVEATLRLTRAPGDRCVMVLGVPALDGLMTVFDAFRNRLVLSAFELFSEQALRHVIDGGCQRPFDTETPYYVLVELENAADEDMETTVLPLYAHCLDRGWLADGVISQSETQAAALWRAWPRRPICTIPGIPKKSTTCAP